MIAHSSKAHGPQRQIRIGYLLRMYPRFSQTFVVNEILELEQQGLDVRILSLRRPTDGIFHESISRIKARAYYIPESPREKVRKSLQIHMHHARNAPGAYVRAARNLIRFHGVTVGDLVQAGHVVTWARKHRIDHLHVHFGTSEATVAMLARMMGGPTYSLTLHAFDIFRDNVDRRLLSRKINTSAFTVTVSQFNRRFIEENVPGVDMSRVRVNYNGIDLERFEDRGLPREPGLVFGVGRLVEKKGFIHLVRAAAMLRDRGVDFRCEIAGDGPETDAIKKAVKESKLRDRVRLLGPIGQHGVAERMNRASCFALPCVAARDGNIDALPTVLLESLAARCPSISTRLSGIPEIIENNVSGVLVDPGDPESLADAIEYVLRDQTAATRLARAGRRRAEELFDVRKNVAVMRHWLVDAAVGSAVEESESASATRTAVASVAVANG